MSSIIVHLHLDIEDGLLQSLLMFTRDLEVQPPVEITQLAGTGELILNIALHKWGYFTHLLKQELLQLLREGLWELGIDDCLIGHRCGHVLFQQVVE